MTSKPRPWRLRVRPLDADAESRAPDDDTWWYVCTICNQAFIGDTKLRTHKWNVHKSKGPANVLILSQEIHLTPLLLIERCCSSSTSDTESCALQESICQVKLEEDEDPDWNWSGGADEEEVSAAELEEQGNQNQETRHQAPHVPCPVCGKLFKSQQILRRHQKIHPQMRSRFKCEECQRTFHFIKTLKKHQVREHAKGTPACPQCPGKTFKSELRLWFHRRHMHRTAICRVCHQEFVGFGRRDRHEFKLHGFVRSKGAQHAYLCEYEGCGMKFAQLQELKEHAAIHRDERSFICETCGQGFKTKTILSRHQLSHIPRADRQHLCPAEGCGKRFARACHLRVHILRVHEGVKVVDRRDRPVPCCVCGKEFKMKATAVTHELRVHNFQRGEGEFKECKTCGKKFSNSYFLSQHEVIHREERANVCDECGKGFKWKFNLHKHKMTHAPYEELQHVCEVCGKRFGWPSHLKDHKRRTHGVGAVKRKAKAKVDIEIEGGLEPESANID